MPSLQILILFALITLALASPHPIMKRSFKVERVPNPNFKRAPGHKRAVGAGTRALIKAHQKYSVSLPPGLLESMRGAGTTSTEATEDGAIGILSTGEKKPGKTPAVASTPNATFTNGTSNGTATSGVVIASPAAGDVEYLSPVTIGGQTMNMDFDSGSSDLWVFSSQLSKAEQTGHTVFDIAKSTTFKMLKGQSYSISYGDGSFSAGNVYVITHSGPFVVSYHRSRDPLQDISVFDSIFGSQDSSRLLLGPSRK